MEYQVGEYCINETVDDQYQVGELLLSESQTGGGGAATRGMPFVTRSTAFNGGRTFQGILS